MERKGIVVLLVNLGLRAILELLGQLEVLVLRARREGEEMMVTKESKDPPGLLAL